MELNYVGTKFKSNQEQPSRWKIEENESNINMYKVYLNLDYSRDENQMKRNDLDLQEGNIRNKDSTEVEGV